MHQRRQGADWFPFWILLGRSHQHRVMDKGKMALEYEANKAGPRKARTHSLMGHRTRHICINGQNIERIEGFVC